MTCWPIATTTNRKGRPVRSALLLLILLAAPACDYNMTLAGPSPAVPNITNTTTNTNNNTNNNQRDASDTAPGTPPASSPGNGDPLTLPLPTYAEGVTLAIAAGNPALVTSSCQDASGEAAWQFLDLVVRTLRAQDQRWGYLCKDANCLTFGRDVIAYKATGADLGIWIVDVLNDHCGVGVAAQWLVLPFDLTRRWAGARKAGIFP